MKTILLFISFVALALAGGDGRSQGRCWTRRVKPKFECYDPAGFAVFGYRAMSKNSSEGSGFSFPVDPRSSYLTNGDGTRTQGPTDFRIGCWTDAWSVPVKKPSKGRKVFWAVGTEIAEVNFRRTCRTQRRRHRDGHDDDDDDDDEEVCQPLPVTCNWASSCTNECPTAQFATLLADGSCGCSAALTVELTFPLIGNQHAAEYDGYLSAVLNVPGVTPSGQDYLGHLALRSIDSAVEAYSPFKLAVVQIVNNALGSLLVSCLDQSDIIFNSTCDPVTGGACFDVSQGASTPIFFVTVLVTLSLDPNVDLSTMTTRIHQTLETYVQGHVSAWNNAIDQANGAICGHASIVALRNWPNPDDTLLRCLFTDLEGNTVDCCPSTWDCQPDHTTIPNGGLTYDNSRCVGSPFAAGPIVFSNSTGSNSLYFSLIDETGKTTYISEVIGARPEAEGYLSLSPIYLLIAAAVVLALILGSAVGVAVYRRKNRDTALAEDEAESMWTSAKASEGRSRAAGLVQ
jgi:hypothetical protein